ncbi:MAG TPA: rhomboid family intramembrane serine protease [Gaiellaceae bacterium]|nr:rhomboid family intramembrane serine protease [Gaiellaceae bacterium]
MAEPRYCYRHPDRETGLSCSDCGRPICVDCMTVAPVGIRCPEHAGTRPRAVAAATRPTSIASKRVRRTAARHGYVIPELNVTRILVAINVLVYLAELAGGSGIDGNSGWIFSHGALIRNGFYFGHSVYPPSIPAALAGGDAGLQHGEWWRLITAAFLHYGPIHLGMNMLALWWLGSPVEAALGRARYLLIYFAAGLAGSTGALLLNPNDVTVGASGAIFGVLGALFVLEYHATGRLMGQAMTLIVINIAFSYAVPNISIGGHLGGLAAGVIGTVALVSFRRYYPAVGRAGIMRGAVVVVIAIAAVLIAYYRVKHFG